MPISDYPKIQNLIEGDYQFKFGDYIDQGFKLFQKHLGPFVGYTVVFFAITWGLGLIPFLGQAVNSFLSPLLVVGFLLVARKINYGQNSEFGDFFGGFKFAPQIILRVIVSSLIFLVAAAPFLYFVWDHGFGEWYWELVANPDGAAELMEDYPGFPFYSLFLLLPAIYLAIAYSWADMFIVFKGMGFWDAMEASRQIISKKWFTLFGFNIVLGLIAMAGLIALCVGIVFSLPAVMCMSYLAFEDVVGTGEEESENDILDHLVS